MARALEYPNEWQKVLDLTKMEEPPAEEIEKARAIFFTDGLPKRKPKTLYTGNRIKVTAPDGEEKIFNKLRECADDFGLTTSVVKYMVDMGDGRKHLPRYLFERMPKTEKVYSLIVDDEEVVRGSLRYMANNSKYKYSTLEHYRLSNKAPKNTRMILLGEVEIE